MKYPDFEKLMETVRALRDPVTGCAWDSKQTHESLLKFLIEESYEFLTSVENKNLEGMKEELGDVLLQVLLHAQIAQEEKHFTFNDIAKELNEKLIRRHPHVFQDNNPEMSVDDVWKQWNEIKKTKEKKTLLDDAYLNFPSLYSAYKIGKKTHDIKFDWDHYQQVLKVVENEKKELDEELSKEVHDPQRIEEELGDLLFSIAQLARHLGLDPETSLRAANKKFLKRFQKMQDLIERDGKNISSMNQKEMDIYWDKMKKDETAST